MPAAADVSSMSAITSGSGSGLRPLGDTGTALPVFCPKRPISQRQSATSGTPRAGFRELAELLPDAPRDVDARHVVHGEDAHGHAEVGEHAIHLLGGGAILHQELRLVHVGEHHAVADEPVGVGHDDTDLAQAGGQGQRRSQRAGACPCRARSRRDASRWPGLKKCRPST